jgi:hypothetical protein
MVVLKRSSEGLKLVDLRDLEMTRQIETEVTLDPGSYIVLPRTSGCTLKRPDNGKEEYLELL